MAKSESGSVVTVGCKLANGLLLELGDVRVHIKGHNPSGLIGGLPTDGITENVSEEFMRAWMAKYADLQFVKEGLLFIHTKTAEVHAEMQDKKGKKTGMEAVETAKDLPAGLTEADKAGA